MKKVAFALFVVLGATVAAFADASPCPTATYDVYTAQGFTCGIGDKTFADFMYQGTSNPPGFGIPAGGVAVTPITTAGNPGFQFSAGWFASTSSGILEEDSLIQYSVSVNPGGALINDLSLSIGGLAFKGTGFIGVSETACVGAMLPSCSGGQIYTLNVFEDSTGSKLFDSVSFAGASEIDLSKDITVQAGTNGSASLSLVTNQFSEAQTPEPGTLSMFGLGVIAIGSFVRRKLGI
jgi:hypothetical protein